jgi:hypothetical protein
MREGVRVYDDGIWLRIALGTSRPHTERERGSEDKEKYGFPGCRKFPH